MCQPHPQAEHCNEPENGYKYKQKCQNVPVEIKNAKLTLKAQNKNGQAS